jgi:tRNA(Ile)-lysidine synthase
LQARARDARRLALTRAATETEAELIATAHHADDRAETVLLRVLRGAGPRGLAVLPPRTGVWIRPQCRARKADILAHLARHRRGFSEDPSNLERRFLRTRVRSELLPLLEQLSPQVVGHLCALADALEHGLEPNEHERETEAVLSDEHGVALVLNRAQRLMVGRARSLQQRSAKVSLPHGREFSLDPVTLRPRVAAAPPRPRKR